MIMIADIVTTIQRNDHITVPVFILKEQQWVLFASITLPDICAARDIQDVIDIARS